MAVTLGQMGLQRHHAGLTNDIFARPFDQEVLAPLRQPLGATAGAKAAAEAANIAASLGGLPDLGLPPVGTFQSGGHTSVGINGGAQVSNLQGYSTSMMNSQFEPRVQDRISDVSNAPPPLPRLSAPSSTGAMRFADKPPEMPLGGDTRLEATVHAAELTLAEAHRMAAAERERGVAGSAGSSWVAPPIDTMQVDNGLPHSYVPPLRINDPGLQQQASANAPGMMLSRVFRSENGEVSEQQNFGHQHNSIRQAYVDRQLSANGYGSTYRTVLEADLPPSQALLLEQQQQSRQPVERLRPMTPPAATVYERPITPRQQVQTILPESLAPTQGYFGVASRQASMPQLNFDGERPGRSRSVPMTPNSLRFAGYLPPASAGYISPVPAAASYACAVWPPPPLPPVSCELTARLDALEAQKNSAIDRVRETRLEKIRGELELAQAAASQCKLLEQQLEQCNVEWKVKFDLLEMKCKQSEAEASSRIAQAVREAEGKSREDLEILRKELQVVRSEGDRALEESQLKHQEIIDRLRRELEETLTSQRIDPSVAQLRGKLEAQQEEVNRLTDELIQLQKRNIALTEQLRTDKVQVDSRSLELRNQQTAYEADLMIVKEKNEDLRRQIKEKTQQRDQLEGDLTAFKAANKQKELECEKLRAALKDEKKEVALLTAEVQTQKAAVELDEAKDRLFSPRMSAVSNLSGQQSMMIDVDMTEDMEIPRRSSRSSSDARRQYGSQTILTSKTVVDVRED